VKTDLAQFNSGESRLLVVQQKISLWAKEKSGNLKDFVNHRPITMMTTMDLSNLRWSSCLYDL